LLDTLFEVVDVERSTAEARGWSVIRWDGSEAQLRNASVVLHVRTRIDRSFLERLPKCRVVARFGTGLDTVDLEAAAERDLTVVGVRDYCIPELVTHTLGMAFLLDRRLDATRSGILTPDSTWQDVSEVFEIPGRTTATVIGAGSVGLAVATALVAMGLTVRVVTSRDPDVVRGTGAEIVGLDEGLSSAGFVLLHTALNPSTAGFVDRSRLGVMQPDTILVNTARLGLIDEAAVADALGSGRLGGLALDAKLEASSPIRPLLADRRVLLTPHLGWYSERSATALRIKTVETAIEAAIGHRAFLGSNDNGGVTHGQR
jgi:phosphoglycerate dehydrogenase-like enzyme